ncbi:MAG: YIP1 family protein [Ardenticatenia bacterium]|nr:YIP1 family protein [Ardenticatenia bacterium]
MSADDRSHVAVPILLIGLVDRPTQTFQAIAAKPRRLWLVPLTLLVLAVLFHTWATADLQTQLQADISQYWIEHGRFAEQMPPEAREEALAAIERQRQEGASSGLLTLSLAAGIVGTMLGWVVWGAVLHYVAKLMGHEGSRFDVMFNVAAWAWIPLGIGLVVRGGFALVTGTLPVNEGLSFLVATGTYARDALNPLFQLLNALTLWQLASWWLLITGTAAVSGIPRRRWAGVVLGIWLLFALLKLVPLMVQRTLMGI